MTSPFVLVIFGATGDLAHNKLIPALFTLFKKQQLPEQFYVVGFARRPLTDDEFPLIFKEQVQDSQWVDFVKHLSYQEGKFEEREGYDQLVKKLAQFDEKMGACIMRLFYLATPPNNYQEILSKLEETKLSEGCGPFVASSFSTSAKAPPFVPQGRQGKQGREWTRIVIEKPFGKDLETAKALDLRLSEIFEEKQIFRVDHYLGKETVQNMLAFRFANGIFEPIWNKDYIDHVQITWAEKEGVDTRGKFFDGIGILRDVAQNHLLQMMGTVTMEQPKSFTKEDVRDARVAAIKALVCPTGEEMKTVVVRGQYEGYKETKDVAKDSNTETYVALKVFVYTPRFAGVPFYIRAGKQMPEEAMYISIVFKQTCHILFKEYGCPEIGNVLTIRIQPNEGISIRVIAKKPGDALKLGTVDMAFSYAQEFDGKGADAYEKVLQDIFAGDQMLFNRSDELESSWTFITNILKVWEKEPPTFPNYEQGTWGPKEAQDLIEKDGRKWL